MALLQIQSLTANRWQSAQAQQKKDFLPPEKCFAYVQLDSVFGIQNGCFAFHFNLQHSTSIQTGLSLRTRGLGFPPCSYRSLATMSLSIRNKRKKQPTQIHSCSIPRLLILRAVKKFLSSRLIINSTLLWNLHQRHKFLRAEASRDILKISISEMAFPGGFKWTTCFCIRIHARLGTIPLKCPQAFHNIAQFECFTDLNLFK